MQILVDAHGLNTSQPTGKHYYTQSLLDSLREDHQLHLFHSKFTGLAYYLHLWFHLKTHPYDLLLLPLSYLPILISPLPTITIIYDLAVFHSHFKSNFKAQILEKLLLPQVLRRSSGLIFLNRFILTELTNYYQLPLPPHVVIPGLPRSFPPTNRPLPTEPPEPPALQTNLYEPLRTACSPYILYVGTLEPRKNLPNLIRAYHHFLQLLKLKNHPLPKLVIVGKKGWYYQNIFQEVARLNLSSSVIFTGYLADEQLPSLYQQAKFFAYLPFYEGFGLPIIEALSFNTPVITSNHPVLAATLGSNGLTVDPHNIPQITQAFLDYYLHPKITKQYQSRFTPKQTALSFNQLLIQL